jgi:hypothetical protein
MSNKLNRGDLVALIRRRDYLLEKIEDKKRNNNENIGYETTEVVALSRIISLAINYIGVEIKEEQGIHDILDKKTNIDVISSSPGIDDLPAPNRKSIVRQTIKEIFRNEGKKLVVTYEYKDNNDWLALQSHSFELVKQRWETGPKTRIYINEISELIDIFTKIKEEFDS